MDRECPTRYIYRSSGLVGRDVEGGGGPAGPPSVITAVGTELLVVSGEDEGSVTFCAGTGGTIPGPVGGPGHHGFGGRARLGVRIARGHLPISQDGLRGDRAGAERGGRYLRLGLGRCFKVVESPELLAHLHRLTPRQIRRPHLPFERLERFGHGRYLRATAGLTESRIIVRATFPMRFSPAMAMVLSM
jgi:hypothetical protein